MPPLENSLQQYVKLEDRLVLLSWLNSLFGYGHNRDMLSDMKEAAEGFDAEGRSFIYHRIVARGSKVSITADALARYDDNIRSDLQAMNARRTEPLTLRYFQHTAALYTEVFLDFFFNRRSQMLRDLNAFVAERNAQRLPGEPLDPAFAESDLKKLAFWMATGSGKTLIMHLNYRQFLRYTDKPLDNILLITPNEGLTDQHLGELAASGIPARRFDLSEGDSGFGESNAVRVIEITKLVEEKRGGGESVPVEAFEGNNLILVDEGHKGTGGEAWRKYRDALGATGYTFEYSATFGQALTAARNDKLTEEYGKAIAFDYSYRYFYGDGYGKDFHVLNLREETDEDKTDSLLLGNLLSFYEQLRLHDDKSEPLRPYNIEKPLWVFVGRSVLPGRNSTEDQKLGSDVLTVVHFLHRVLQNKRGWATKTIGKLLEGKSGLLGPPPAKIDIFAEKFGYLRDTGASAEAMYEDILARVLHAPASGGLHLCDIRGSDGEIGLKAAGADEYFGLIYIGDTSGFKKLVEAGADSEIVIEEDALSGSLFSAIARPDTTIDLLIGAKKFMEGWNSWRVSTMGLLNIGRQEGSQIIQLFGRGVRLRGKEMSLKRSSALRGTHPPRIGLLETLNIFAVRANYMGQFREYLEREGVETDERIELPLFVQSNNEFLRHNLVLPRIPDGVDFASSSSILLEPDAAADIHLDMSVKVETIQSAKAGITVATGQSGRQETIPEESLCLIDWERAQLDLLEFKKQKGFSNLVIPAGAAKTIIAHRTAKGTTLYRLIADEEVVRPVSFRGRALLQQAVTNVLRKYMENFYRIRREQWESHQMVYLPLDEADPNLSFNRKVVKEKKTTYVVSVKRSETELVKSLQKLVTDAEKLYKEENSGLPRIHFDRHLYVPLLIEKGDESLSAVPPPLKPAEAQFVRDLKEYWEEEKGKSLKGKEIFLLRNLSRGSGVGFFEERGFFPDFILWVVSGKSQRLVFIEPHGMVFAKSYVNDEKARLHEDLPALADEIRARSKSKRTITLDSFILSATAYEDLHKKYDDGNWDKQKFAQHHILFAERTSEYDYLKTILPAVSA